jgi:hypothetical protein
MGEYSLKTHIFVIEIEGCDIVLSVEWIKTLTYPITMDFLELYMSFYKHGNFYMFKGLKEGFPEIINCHFMEKLLKWVIL